MAALLGRDLAIVDLKSGEILARKKTIMDGDYYSAWKEFSPDGRVLALSKKGEIFLLDSKTLKVIKNIKVEEPGGYRLGFRRRDRSLILITSTGKILQYSSGP